jgi:phospholipid/cholesterol/gamma-HCH transport system permease protein
MSAALPVSTGDPAPVRPAPKSGDGTIPLAGPIGKAVEGLGDWALFSARAVSGVVRRSFGIREMIRISAEVGVNSLGVVATTGMFIGMVMAVQAYNQFHRIGLETSLGAMIHMTVVKELGPVLAAVMLAGRIGSAMAAELATMRVTEQIDALACLGVDPVRYLVGPRFLACLVMVPLLTVFADLTGLVGSSVISLHVFGIEPYHYWKHSREFVGVWDVMTGLVKAFVFGGTLSLIACHRGFNSRPGAEGVGRAATQAFVFSFVAILAIDFVMALFSNTLYDILWPDGRSKAV